MRNNSYRFFPHSHFYSCVMCSFLLVLINLEQNSTFNKMSQDVYYKTLRALMKDLSSTPPNNDGADCPSNSAMLNRLKIGEENFDKAATLDEEKLQTQKEDGRDNNITFDQRPLSDTSTKFDEGMSELAASGSGKSKDVGETSNEDSLDKQQECVDLLPDHDCTNLIQFMPVEFKKDPSSYISFLELIYKGQYKTAKTTCETKLEELLQKTRTNDNDLHISIYFEILALIYRKTNRYDGSITLLRKVLEIHQAILGSNHRIVGITFSNLGICLAKVGNYVEANTLCRSALQIALGTCDVVFITEHFYYLGVLHQIQDRHNSAAEFYEQGLRYCVHQLVFEHPNRKKIVQNLTTCYLKQGKVKEAEALLKRW